MKNFPWIFITTTLLWASSCPEHKKLSKNNNNIMLESTDSLYSQAQSNYQKLNEVATKLNKAMPQRIDEYTEIDSLTAISPDTLQYYATLLYVNKTPESINRIKQIMEAKMLNTIKTEKDFKPYRENKIKIVYRYYDESNLFLFSIYLTPEKYLN